MDVEPFMNELQMMKEEADFDFMDDPTNKRNQLVAQEIEEVIKAAKVFSEELAKVPTSDLKPNFMLQNSRNPFEKEKAAEKGTASAVAAFKKK